MKTARLLILAAAICAIGLLPGCKGDSGENGGGDTGGSSKLDLTTSIEQLKAQIADLSIEDLEAKAMQYKEALAAKEGEITALMEKFKALPIAEQLGQEAQALQQDIQKLTESASGIKERLQVYLEAIKEKGGEIKAELMP